MKIQLIRNATMRIDYGNEVILTDPMLANKGAYRGFVDRENLVNPTAELNISLDEIKQNISAVLVSHTHITPEGTGGPSDHFDEVAINQLDKTLPVYTQSSDVVGLKKVGFSNVHAIDESIQINQITVRRFAGRHADVDALLPLVGDVSAFYLQAQGQANIFWTGDTLLTDEMRTIMVELEPDVVIVHAGGAILPIDDKGNTSQLVMNADDTIEIAKMLPNAKIIAIHMESLDHCPVTRKELLDKVKDNQIDNVLIPGDGETICL